MSPIFNTVLSATAALCVVLGLVLLAARAARWLGLGRPAPPRARSQQRLAAEASLPLDRVRTVHIIRCDGRELAVLTGGPADVLLGWLPDQPVPAPRAVPQGAGA